MGVIIVEDAETDKKQGNSWPNTSVNKHRKSKRKTCKNKLLVEKRGCCPSKECDLRENLKQTRVCRASLGKCSDKARGAGRSTPAARVGVGPVSQGILGCEEETRWALKEAAAGPPCCR